jgi:hypothetical protein
MPKYMGAVLACQEAFFITIRIWQTTGKQNVTHYCITIKGRPDPITPAKISFFLKQTIRMFFGFSNTVIAALPYQAGLWRTHVTSGRVLVVRVFVISVWSKRRSNLPF